MNKSWQTSLFILIKKVITKVRKIAALILPRIGRQPVSSPPPMQAAPLPSKEEERLEALHRYDILHTEAEAAFDDLTALASYICGPPIALVSWIESNR
ncbi:MULTISPECIES: hypothetical protein [unclassified Microcoleus]|uniref:hypothetical protein n=1 Tax=unclassified Microcoleus TaxID=2642155 RepID=UPI002FD22E59